MDIGQFFPLKSQNSAYFCVLTFFIPNKSCKFAPFIKWAKWLRGQKNALKDNFNHQ
jgi:hypothetical protein